MSPDPAGGAARAPHGSPSGGGDPRRTITPESFAVAPELLGLPLARPWRRAVAMLFDLVIGAILVNAGGIFLALGGAVVLWRATRRRGADAPTPFLRVWARRAARALAVLVFLVGALVAVFTWGDDDDDASVDASLTVQPGMTATFQGMGLLGGLGALADLNTLRRAATVEEARAPARKIVGILHASGATRRDLLTTAQELPSPSDSAGGFTFTDAARAAILEAIDSVAPAPETPETGSLEASLAVAMEEGDSAATADARRRLAILTLADTLAALDDEIRSLEDRNDDLAEEVRALEEDEGGFLDALLSWADELGVGVGWFGLYFTAFLALWRGQTPGKRLLGLRVVRLDGKPIGWWAAFERFGGYAAGFVTGLLGFAQVLWDDNRQGIHDQIARTVVIHERR